MSNEAQPHPEREEGGGSLLHREAGAGALAGTPSGVPATAGRRREWRPTAGQERALAAAVSNPRAATNKQELCRMVPECYRTVVRWFSNPAFRAWWNKALVAIAQASMGPAMMELERIIGDPDVSDAVKVRAIDTMLKHVAAPDQGVGHAVAAIIERWTGSGQLRLAARGDEIALEVRGVGEAGDAPAPQEPPPEMDHWDRATIKEAVQMGPATVEAAAKRVAAHIREEAGDQATTEEQRGYDHRRGRDPTRGAPLGAIRAAPRLRPQGVGGPESPAPPANGPASHAPDCATDESPTITTPTPDPATTRVDFMGRTYVARGSGQQAPRVGQDELMNDHRLDVD